MFDHKGIYHSRFWVSGFGFRVQGSGVLVNPGLVFKEQGVRVNQGVGLWVHGSRKVDLRLPGNGNSNTHDARPVY